MKEERNFSEQSIERETISLRLSLCEFQHLILPFMKLLRIKNAFMHILCFLCLYNFSSCESDNDDPFVKRDTDEFQFEYTQSSQSLSVRTNGEWSVNSENDWIHLDPLSGTGNGNDYQNVNITVKHNSSEAREGIVYLTAAGKTVEVKIYQDNGILTWDKPYFEGTLLEGEEIKNARVFIPYNKAMGEETVSLDIKLSGDGAEGISAVPVKDFQLTAGSGTIVLSLQGIPRSMGDLLINLKANISIQSEAIELPAMRSFVASDNIIYEMDFNKLVWGGDYMANLPGIRPASITTSMLPTDEPTEVCKATDDGSADLMSAKMADFKSNRGLAEWTGSKVYEKIGYVKIGTGSAKGYLVSPKLDLEGLGCPNPCTLFMEFQWARWDNENDPLIVSLIGAGEMQEISLIEVHKKREWQTLVVKIKNATPETQVKISGTNDKGNNRFFIDNWKIYASGAK